MPLLVAAMGPLLLRLAGRLTDGTITTWVGPRTVESHIVPTIQAAAAAAGRPAPRVIVSLPIALTDDPDGLRERFALRAAFYSTLPTYRAMFEREKVAGPADVALVGDEVALDAGLRRPRDAGASDYVASVISEDDDSTKRTLQWLAAHQST